MKPVSPALCPYPLFQQGSSLYDFCCSKLKCVNQNVVWYSFVNLPCKHENSVCSVVAVIHRCELYPLMNVIFQLFIYLAVWGLSLACGTFIASCGICCCSSQTSCDVQAQQLGGVGAKARGFSTCGTPLVALWHVGS